MLVITVWIRHYWLLVVTDLVLWSLRTTRRTQAGSRRLFSVPDGRFSLSYMCKSMRRLSSEGWRYWQFACYWHRWLAREQKEQSVIFFFFFSFRTDLKRKEQKDWRTSSPSSFFECASEETVHLDRLFSDIILPTGYVFFPSDWNCSFVRHSVVGGHWEKQLDCPTDRREGDDLQAVVIDTKNIHRWLSQQSREEGQIELKEQNEDRLLKER